MSSPWTVNPSKGTEGTKKIRFEHKDDNRYDATKTQFWEKEISDIISGIQQIQTLGPIGPTFLNI